MNAWAKQQTAETIRQNIETWAANHMVSDERGEAGRKEYRAEKTRLYKLRLIKKWRNRK